MILELDDQKRKLLADLLSSRISELHSEIRRCRVSDVKDDLKHDLEVLQATLGQLEHAPNPAPAGNA